MIKHTEQRLGHKLILHNNKRSHAHTNEMGWQFTIALA